MSTVVRVMKTATILYSDKVLSYRDFNQESKSMYDYFLYQVNSSSEGYRIKKNGPDTGTLK